MQNWLADRKVKTGLLVGAGAIGLGWLYLFDPAVTQVIPTCPFHSATGLYCPACGATRAAHQLLHGHFEVAFHFNALLFVLIPFLAWVAYGYTRHSLTGQPLPYLNRRAQLGLLLTLLVFAVIRNLPFSPFTLLIPN